MKYQHLFRLLLLGCLFNLIIGHAQAEYVNQGEKLIILNFGRITAAESVTNQLLLSEKLHLSMNCGVTLQTEQLGLLEIDSGRILPWERILLLSGAKQWMLAPNLTKELLIASGQVELTFTLQLSITPHDPPGNYEGIFYLQPWQKSGTQIERLKRLKVMVRLTIAPWIKLEQEKIQVELNEADSQNFTLGSERTFCLRVASNTKWAVALALNRTSKINQIPVPISLKVATISNFFQGSTQVFGNDGALFKRIAIGMPTVTTERYWVELPLNFLIQDYHRYPAGSYQFEFDCRGEILLDQGY